MTGGRFIDVLNWDTLVAPGVMICKDGSLLAGWEFTGIDTESQEPDALAGYLAHLGRGLSQLVDGETVWAVFERRPWVPETEPETTEDKALDALALESHLMLAGEGATWSDRLLLFFGWMPEVPGPSDESLAGFDEALEKMESRLGGVYGLRRLVPEGPGAPCPFCGALARLLGQSRTAPRFRKRDLPVGLDMVIGGHLRQTRRTGPLTLDGRAVAVLALEGLPVTYGIAPLERFQDLPCAFAWVTRYEGISPASARGVVRKRQRFWRQGSADLVANVAGEGGGRRDLYGDAMAESLDDVEARIRRGLEGHGHFVSVFLLQGETRAALLPSLAMLRSAADDGHYGLREERANAIPALLSALPGHTTVNSRRVVLRAQAMADLMPVRTIWRGDATCPSPRLPAGTPALLEARARTGEHVHVNLHNEDVGHTLLFGPTGAGKSVLLGRIAAAWLRYPGGPGDLGSTASDRARMPAQRSAAPLSNLAFPAPAA